MGTYAYKGQQIVRGEDGRLVGFNAGFGYHAEHELGFTVQEPDDDVSSNLKQFKKAFGKEIVPKKYGLFMYSNKNVAWLTNDLNVVGYLYEKINDKTDTAEKEKVLDDKISRLLNDVEIGYAKQDNEGWVQPEITAFWREENNHGIFDLAASTEDGKKILEELYSEMSKRKCCY